MASRRTLSYPVFQATDANGLPLVNGTVEFFDAGTTTQRDTYSDPGLTTPNPNPVTLNSRGEPESGGGTPINIYLDNQPYKIVLKDSSGTTIRTVDNYGSVASTDSSDVDHDLTTNFVANEHIDHSGVTLTAGEGLTGGGDITASRTFNVDIGGQTSVTAASTDELLIEDASDAANKKKVTAQSIADLSSGGSSSIFVDVTNFGATGDGTTDDTSSIQSALNDAASFGNIVWFPEGDYRITSQLVVPKGVAMWGTSRWFLPTNPAGDGSTGVGSKIKVDFGAGAGVEDTTQSAILLRTQTTVKGLFIWYPGQVTTGTPNVFPPAISAVRDTNDTAELTEITITENFFFNPYTAVHIKGTRVGRVYMTDNVGVPFRYGGRFDGFIDFSFFSRNIWQPGRIHSDTAAGSLREWIQDNGFGWEVGQMAWPVFTENSLWSYNVGVTFVNTTNGSVNDGVFSNLGLDSCATNCFRFAGDTGRVIIDNCRMVAQRSFDGTSSGAARAIGAAAGVNITGLIVSNCNTRGINERAIDLTGIGTSSGQFRIVNNKFESQGASGTVGIDIDPADQVTIMGNQITGYNTNSIEAPNSNNLIVTNNFVPDGLGTMQASAVIANNQPPQSGGGGGGTSSVDAEDNGTVVVSGTTAINFSSELSVTDDGDGTVTVDALPSLTSSEISQLSNINFATISSTQWGWLGGLPGEPLHSGNLAANGGNIPQINRRNNFAATQVISGRSDPLSGTGLELHYDAGAGFNRILSYDRDTSSSIPLEIWASPLAIPKDGVTIGNPTGANQGVGTLNAEAVYDDGSLLTDYVLDAEIDGSIDYETYDATTKDGNHAPARAFEFDELDEKEYGNKVWKFRKLPAIHRMEAKTRPSISDHIQALIETCEAQSVHIEHLRRRIDKLES